MSNATTNALATQMPAWADRRDDVDLGTSDAYSAFLADAGSLTAFDPDTYMLDNHLSLTVYADTADCGEVAPMQPIIEVSSSSYSNVVFSLTLADARNLAEMLTAAADRIEAGR